MRATVKNHTLFYFVFLSVIVCFFTSLGTAQYDFFNQVFTFPQPVTTQRLTWNFPSYTPASLNTFSFGSTPIYNNFGFNTTFRFPSVPSISGGLSSSYNFFRPMNVWNVSGLFGNSTLFGGTIYNPWNYGWNNAFLGGSYFGGSYFPPQQPPTTGMANPAAVYCIENGGNHIIETDAQGNQYGICVFADGSECDAWEFYRGECYPLPSWLSQLIATLEQEPVANPPAKIIRYTYHDSIVYFVPQKCCDFPSILYDDQGTVLCNPDGGFTGRGDGRCPDFFSARTNEKIIWADERTYPPAADQPAPSQGALDPQPGDERLIRGNVYLNETDILLLESFPVQVKLLIKGYLPTPCNKLRVTVSKPDDRNRIDVSLYSLVDPETFCAQVLQSFDERVSLGSFKQGSFSVWINGEHHEDFSL
ncbi:MAG: DUF333 domain-containing protein [bacterium]